MAGTDWFLVVGVVDAAVDVAGAAQVLVVNANTEEQAVAKAAPVLTKPRPDGSAVAIKLYVAQVVTTFPPP
jgi:hypothetical protein